MRAAAAGWLASSPREGTPSNWLRSRPGSGSQGWPTALLCPRRRLWTTGCGASGAEAGKGRRGVLRERRGGGGSPRVGMPARGAASLPPEKWLLSCRSSLVQQDRGGPAFCLHPRGAGGPPEWSSRHPPGQHGRRCLQAVPGTWPFTRC